MRAITKILLLLALVLSCAAQASSTNLFSYAYPFNGTANALNGEYLPVYSLGTLSVNNTLSCVFNFPNLPPSSTALATFITILSASSQHGLQFMDPTTNTLTQANGIVYPTPTEKSTYRMSYTITFTNPNITAAAFYIVLTYPVSLNFLYYYTIEITYSSAATISVGSTSQGVTLLKLTDFIRQTTQKLIYVSQPGSVFNFSAYPAATCSGGGCTDIFTVTWRALTTNASVAQYGFNGNQINLGTAVTLTPKELVATNYTNNIAHYSQTFNNSGFYLLDFQPATTDFVNVRLTFNTDIYACPVTGYNDYYLHFQGCTGSSTPSGAPCLTYNPVTQTCSACIQGYTLVNGSCLANTTCPARQYFSYGVCVNVSSLCGSFDSFTGACLNCSDPANYDFSNGSCVRKSVTCAANQWQANYTCFNASANCSTFDPNTGKCLTCLSNLYQLNADGSCTLIVVNCPQGQYAVGLNCVTIPNECLNFDRALGKCLSCVKGYFVEGGVCKRIVCPEGQVPSGYGIFCVNVSPLCGAYDSISGDCLSCKQQGYTVREGKCVQIGSGLAGCAEREALGFGPCIGADLNCKTFNLITGNCDECSSGFYLDFTGHCAPNAKCGANQWSVNGECLSTPDNCQKVDSVGLCTQCVNENYRLQQGQCVFFKSCQPQQYLNSAGQCVDVSASCGTFNPTNGLCVTCKEAGSQPISGVCCPAGQVYNAGNCVDAAALQRSYQSATGPSCLVRHPSLNFCLKCAEGYSPDYTVPYACAQN